MSTGSLEDNAFSFSAWQDAQDVLANPVENKLRRDWLSRVLFEQLENYRPTDDSEELEFLHHYADRLFVACLS